MVKINRWGVCLLLILCCWLHAEQSMAVLKEKDINATLTILRQELMNKHDELEKRSKISASRNERIMKQFRETYHLSNQNSLMLYSQRPEYVFDLTYACHEATKQFQEFTRHSLPLKRFIEKNDAEIARYDSLIGSLEKMMRFAQMDEKARIDCNVCLTMATNIRNSMKGNREDLNDYERLYKQTGQRLKNLNDYANKRYNEIQSNIFKNGGDSYFAILASLRHNLMATAETVTDKYRPLHNIQSQWNSRFILDLFLGILIFAIVSVVLNFLAFRFLPKRFHTKTFLKKRTCIILTTTTITFAIIIGLLRTFSDQNFLIMASSLLVEYAWLLCVILLSLLLRVEGDQIKSAFLIYAPLIFMGFIVISFRIVLVPNDLVNLIFPPILLLCTIWQWSVIRKHHKKIPRSDMFYSYISLIIFLVSTVCAWIGYTLMSVQLLIWWIMQLACILTITCIASWMKDYSKKHKIYDKPITKNWIFRLVYEVLLPVMALLSIPLSIYMAADVFNLSTLTWQYFTMPFVNAKNFRLSLFSIIQVAELYFFFKYVNSVCLELLHLHFKGKNYRTNASSREVMGKNVTQVLVWGAWLLISLSIFHIGGKWLAYIATGLSTGVGFASKDILENLYYGINLMAGRVKVGDWIECDGIKGKVASISYTSTMLEAIDGSIIAFTNSQLFTKNYKNLTKNHGYVLSLIPFGVAYGSNMKDVTTIIEEAVNGLNHPYLDPSKQVKVVFTEFGDSSINFQLLCWVDAVKQIYVVSDVMQCIYNTLDAHNISIPFPQCDVHVKEAIQASASAAS